MDSRRHTVHPEDFARFLSWLDPDPERAGEVYNLFHRKLTMYFTGRGCGVWAADLASETLDRTAGKFSDGGVIEDREPGRYLFHVAGFILREHFRRHKEAPLEPDIAGTSPAIEEPVAVFCCKSCLRRFSNDEKTLLQDYFAGEKEGESKRIREEVATDLNLAPGALRIKVFRLKQKLTRCMTECLQSDASGNPRNSPADPVM
jgi:hypothetical protein